MKYMNPYEIATFIKFNNLDITTFKKFKRRLFAELELNDGKVTVNGKALHQNEIYEIIDLIDRNKELLNIFKSLYDNKGLNEFLNGNIDKDIKKLKNLLHLEDIKTIQFITPFLVDTLSKMYKEAFLNNEIKVLEIEPPLDESNCEVIYEPIYQLLKNKEKELLELKKNFYDLDDVKNIIVNLKTLNSLPDYFNKIRNDIAYAIRNLSIDSWNDNENLDLAIDLINYALKFNVNNKTKDKFLSDKDDLENILQEQKIMEDIVEIDEILQLNQSFSQKINTIITFLENKDSLNKDKLALPIFNLINKYIENNIEMIMLNIDNLKLLFKKLLSISSNYELKNAIQNDINTLNKLSEEIQKNKEKKYSKYGMIIGGVLGLAGGMIGAIIGVISGSIIGWFIAKF